MTLAQRPPRLLRFAVLLGLLSSSAALGAHPGGFDLPEHPDLRTLHASGHMAESFDLVITGDGYTAGDRTQFFEDAAALAQGLLSFGPYGDSQGLINVHALFVASEESGADHPSQGVDVQTAFDATYESFGVSYLITASEPKVLSAVAAVVPGYDLAVLLVNDTEYGGSGGAVSMVSRAPESIGILRHELGHTIADLADEYAHPNPAAAYIDPEPNVATAEHIAPPPWHVWIEDGTPVPTPDEAALDAYSPIGAYEGARYLAKGMYRPAPHCLMRSLDRDFCPVCHEALLVALAAESQMLRRRSPPDSEVACVEGSCPDFSVTSADVTPQSLTWRRDGVVVGSGLSWTPGDLRAGAYELTVTLHHNSPRVRSDPKGKLVEKTAWHLLVAAKAPPVPPVGASQAAPSEGQDGGCSAGASSRGQPLDMWLFLLATTALLRARRRNLRCE